MFNNKVCILCLSIFILCTFFSCASLDKNKISNNIRDDVKDTKVLKDKKTKDESTSSFQSNESQESLKAKKENTSQDFLLETQVANNQTQQKSLLDLYLQQIEKVKITALSVPKETVVGRVFNSSFDFQITDFEAKPIEGLSLTISYPSSRIAEKIQFTSVQVISDVQGVVSFVTPLPDFACNNFILCYVTPQESDAEVSQYITENSLKVEYKVHSNKISSVYSISMLDYDESGRPIRINSLTSSALLQGLYKKGVYYVSNSDWIDEINTDNHTLLYTNAKKLFHNSISYLIYGKVKYLEPVTRTDEGNYTTTWNIVYSVMDMKNGEDVLSGSFSASGEGSTQWELFDTIRRDKIATTIADEIFYGL